MNYKNEISRLFFQLENSIDELKNIIRSADIVQAISFELPLIDPNTKELPSFEKRTIKVTKVDDRHLAIAIANKAYSQFTFNSDMSKRFASRCPGIIQLGKSYTKTVSELINIINGYKNEIKMIVTHEEDKIPRFTRNERFNLLRDAIPGVITLQLYRNIICIEDQLSSISFTWANKQSVTKISFKELKALLEVSKNNTPVNTLDKNWSDFIEKEVKLITDSKATNFKIRRPIPANPMVNLRLNDSSKKMRHAHLPIIVFGDDLIKVSSLKNYEPKVGHFREKIEIEKYLIDRLKIIPIL